MNFNDIDPKRIRKCELIIHNNEDYIQFIAIGDRHKMMKMEDGQIEIIKLPEQGKDYRYGDPVPLDNALQILDLGLFSTHRQIAQQIRNHLAEINKPAS